MLTDRHARGQPSTCVRHKDLSCLTTGCVLPNMWRWLQKPAPAAATPFISPRNTEDDGRCFPRWAAKWLPLSKGRGRTWLMDSCGSCEIAWHLERPDRKKKKKKERTRGERREMRRKRRDREKPLRCDARDQSSSSLRFQLSVVWNCGFKCERSDSLPTATPLILHSSSAYHEMCRLARSQKHSAQSWLLWIPLSPVGFSQKSPPGMNLHHYIFCLSFFFHLFFF